MTKKQIRAGWFQYQTNVQSLIPTKVALGWALDDSSLSRARNVSMYRLCVLRLKGSWMSI